MSEQSRFNHQDNLDNAVAIEQRIEELETMIADNEFSGFSSQAKEIDSLFKLGLSRDDREHLRSRYQECWTAAKAKWEEDAHVSQENAKTMSKELDALDALAEKKLYKDFWQKQREINSLFKDKSLKFPRESKKVSSWLGDKLLWESRQGLWQRFQDICGEVKAQRERLEAESESNKNRILDHVSTARFIARSAFDAEGFMEVQKQLDEVRAMLKKDTTLIKPHSDECWDAYREINENLHDKREKKQFDDYEDIKSDIKVIEKILGADDDSLLDIVVMAAIPVLIPINAEEQSDPHRALQLVRDAQQKRQSAFLSKNQHNKLREDLQQCWDWAIRKIEARKKVGQEKHEQWVEKQQAWQEKQEIWREKQQAWRERTIAARDRKQERLDNQEVYIDRLKDQIDKLEDDIENARSETWAEKARGWLQEKYEKMRDVEEQIQQLKQEIADINEKLDNQNI